MEPTFRASMNWLHTWTGVVLGGLLFAVFWMGTLSVFDREIDRWMAPTTRLALPDEILPAETFRPSIEAAAAAGATIWTIVFPEERQPVYRETYRSKDGNVLRFLDPLTGAALPDPGTLAGTRFIFPFHYSLNVRAWDIGYWLVGVAGMAMLVLCVSGVVIHRKIFTEFFTFRAEKKPRRLILDLHNVTGVLGLPFHFIISLSGLIIFFSIYFPSVWQMPYDGKRELFNRETWGTYTRPKVDQAAPLASLDDMVAEARRVWAGEEPFYMRVTNPGDAAAVVQIGRTYRDVVTMRVEILYFDAPSGALLSRFETLPLVTAQRFIAGLHFIQFQHWTLRWIYFVLGLVGCVLIATGYLFWLESRRRKHAQLGMRGVPFVEGLTVGSVTGIVVATLGFFVANRLLPLDAAFLGVGRASLEMWIFYLVWLATFAHAWLRPRRAWAEQSWMIAVLAIAAVVLNWISTGDHLGRSLTLGHLGAIGGMDLVLLAGASVATLTALKLEHRKPDPVRERQHA